MSRAALLQRAWRAYRAGRIGDAAAYKSAALAPAPRAAVAGLLSQLANPLPRIDLAELRACPAGSFGHAYLAFLEACRLTPLVLTDAVRDELAAGHVLAVRYPLLHDAFHVLLGFDTSLPGELGVWSFVAAQDYSPSYRRAFRVARFLYPLMAPLGWRALRRERRRGEALGRHVPCLIAQPLDDFWATPITELRRQLGIARHTDADGDGEAPVA